MTAKVVERNLIRYTPAGIPVLDLKLLHQSEQIEAETKRQINFEITAVAIGDITATCESLSSDKAYRFTGFLTAKSLKNKSLQFHITGISIIE